MQHRLIILVALCALGAGAVSGGMSRRFSAAFYDMSGTLRRYANCVDYVAPLRSDSLNSTDYLTNQIKVFLNQADYDNEQLANITSFLDTICLMPQETREAPWISPKLNLTIYDNSYNEWGRTGKFNRCQAVDAILEAIYPVLKQAAANETQPLDLKGVRFFPNPSNKLVSYGLRDLANGILAKAEVSQEQVCAVANPVKGHLRLLMASTKIQKRYGQGQSTTWLGSILDLWNRLVESLWGAQKRLSWESTNRLEQGYNLVGDRLAALRASLGRGYKETRDRVSGLIWSGSKNGTTSGTAATNATGAGLVPLAVAQPSTAYGFPNQHSTPASGPISSATLMNSTQMDSAPLDTPSPSTTPSPPASPMRSNQTLTRSTPRTTPRSALLLA